MAGFLVKNSRNRLFFVANMNQLKRQLNRVAAISMLSLVASFIGFNSANAGIFDWFSGKVNNVSGSQTLSSFSSFLSSDNQTVNDGQTDKRDLPVIQNSSIVSVSSPLTIRSSTNTGANKTNELTVLVTAYSSTPDQTDDSPFITAMGTGVRDGIVATNFLPFGTKIKMPEIYGDRVFIVEDRMNRRFWHTVDIWFPDRASAKEFGVKTIKIQILES